MMIWHFLAETSSSGDTIAEAEAAYGVQTCCFQALMQ